ncbi:Plasmodium vivax Vir protein, putative [Plasmodium ovale]|uniref:Plasmodium vivax Vir protein, putative n=1 Tax=Plasmodium ovale TaxID=36330 RepID=A0A1C3KG39_PLAOA|nr:Plasmodium vivax Vir protein, putative [Plasmodium ovale]
MQKGNLQHLPAYATYNDFENQNNEEFCNMYFDEVLKLQDQRNGIKDLCINIAGVLKDIQLNLSNKYYINYRCKYLNFYLYEQIRKRYGTHTREDTDNIISAFHNGWYNIKSKLLKDECGYRYDRDTTLEKWNDMKIIYDYKQNYNNIKENYHTDYNTCKINIEYLQNVKLIYEKWNSFCCSGAIQCRYYYYDCDSKKDPEELLKHINCPESTKDDSLQASPEGRIGSSAEQGRGSHLQGEEEIGGDNDASIIDPLKTSMFVINPLIGIVFSPLGPWLRSQIKRNIKHISKNEVTEESLEYISEYNDINSNNIPYNISYQHI